MEALKKVKEFNPDLLIIDLMLPEMDGWETYRHLRVFSSVPVMVVSAISDKEKIVAALKMGVDDSSPNLSPMQKWWKEHGPFYAERLTGRPPLRIESILQA
jgi:CheY-like chemotaxis protein